VKTARNTLAAVVVLAVAAAFFASCRNKGPERFNLLLITMDTTRADSIGAYGNREASTPNIDRLAQNGIRFRNCYAQVPLTLPSHCTLFTGRYPLAHGVRNNGTYFLAPAETTLAEILKAGGFRTFACIASFTLLSKFGLAQGFEAYDETFQQQQTALNFHDEVPADEIGRKFSAWLEKNQGGRFFTWLHFFDPHYPYRVHPELDVRFARSERLKYEGEIAYVDLHIGRIVRQLESRGLLERTIIVIAGDHGEAFGEHQEFGHGVFCYEESLKVPLVLYNPVLFPTGRTIDSRVGLVDVLPSLLHYLGVRCPGAVQGKSFHGLVAGKKEERPRDMYFESRFGMEANNWAPITGMVVDEHKYISLLEPELYDLERDPGERVNLHRQQSILAHDLDRRLRRFLVERSVGGRTGRRELSPADVASLKTLGYISAASGRAAEMIDPKQGYGLYAQVERLKEKARTGDGAQVQAELERLIAAHPGVRLPGFFELEFSLQKNSGRTAEALATLEKAVTVFPDHELFKLILATERFQQGEPARAQRLCRELLAQNPRFAAATVLLGDIARRQGRRDEAVAHYRHALDIEPQNTRLRQVLSDLASPPRPEDGPPSPQAARLDGMEKEAVALIAAGRLGEARSILQRILRIDPDHVAALVNIGTVAHRSGELDAALNYFRKAARLDPGQATAFSNMGTVCFGLFQQRNDRAWLPQALRHFQDAIRLDPGLSDAYNGRGAVYLALNRGDEAVGDFRKVIELQPGNVNAHFNLAYALVGAGRKKEALDALLRFKGTFYDRLDPRDRRELDALIAETGS
jgi:tetratricopeptide (TPR) repeat protein